MTRHLIAEFIVEGAPQSKQRPRHTRGGHTYTPKETLNAEEVIRIAYEMSYYKFPAMEKEPLEIEMWFYLPNNRTKDWDNLGKLVSDALNKVAYRDDSQITDAHVHRRVDKVRPRTEVRLYLME